MSKPHMVSAVSWSVVFMLTVTLPPIVWVLYGSCGMALRRYGFTYGWRFCCLVKICFYTTTISCHYIYSTLVFHPFRMAGQSLSVHGRHIKFFFAWWTISNGWIWTFANPWKLSKSMPQYVMKRAQIFLWISPGLNKLRLTSFGLSDSNATCMAVQEMGACFGCLVARWFG